MLSLPSIRECFDAFESEELDVTGRSQAAVALILRGGDDGTEVLFIERAQREGDPWSGHMAFPGGRLDVGDADARSAAERETLEEVGLLLSPTDRVGHLADVLGSPRVKSELVISAFVYELKGERPPLSLERAEVAEAFWFPVAGLLDSHRHVDFEHRHVPGTAFPGIEVGVPERHVVWGLTYRFLDIFFEVLGQPLPDRWGDLRPDDPNRRAEG